MLISYVIIIINRKIPIFLKRNSSKNISKSSPKVHPTIGNNGGVWEKHKKTVLAGCVP